MGSYVGKNQHREREPDIQKNEKEQGAANQQNLPELISLKRKLQSNQAKNVKYWKFYPDGLLVPPNISIKELAKIHSIQIPQQADKVLRSLEEMGPKWAIKASKLNAAERKVWMPNDEMRLWQVSRKTGMFLYWFVKNTQSLSTLELGTSGGYSGIWLALGAKQFEGTLYTADMSKLKIGMASKNFEAAGVDNIVQLHGTIAEVLANWHVPLDLVFLDADKANYASYLKMLLPKLKVGGYVVADNAYDFMELMGDMISLLRNREHEITRLYSFILNFDNGLYMIRKGKPIDNALVTSFFNAKLGFI